jgi:hypothetical protein
MTKTKKTPKRIAADIYDRYWSDVSRKPVSKQDPLPDIRPLIEKAIIAAVEEEREACALICDGHENDHRSAPEDSPVQYAASEAATLASAIRARGRS